MSNDDLLDDSFVDECRACDKITRVHIWNGRALCDDCADRLLQGPLDDDAADAWSALRTYTFTELLQLPEPRWLINGVVPDGLSVLYGPPSTLKTFVALDMALSVATALPWQGSPVERGKVLFAAGEGSSGLKLRVPAWWEAHGRPDMSLAHFLPQPVDLLTTTGIEAVRATLSTLQPVRLLVIDTLARSMIGGDESSSRDMGQFIGALDSLDVGARLVVHHTGKDGKLERGSSALRGAADMMAEIERQGQGLRIDLTCAKHPKDGAAWLPMAFKAEPVAESLVLRPVSVFVAAKASEDDRRERVLAAVGKLGPASRTKIVEEVGGKVTLARTTLDTLVFERLVIEAERGQAKVYSLPRPSGEDGVGTGFSPAHADRTPSPRGEDPVGVPGGDGAGRAPSTTPSPTTSRGSR